MKELSIKDKKLILKDLCARLPYNVIGLYSWKNREPYNRELTGCLFDELKSSWDSTEDSQFLPYLRSMRSMTEEEKEEFAEVTGGDCSYDIHGNFFIDLGEFICEGSPVSLSRIVYVINWLYAHHFDVNDLISKGLALEAPKGMYN
jgi:hypothetical protein